MTPAHHHADDDILLLTTPLKTDMKNRRSQTSRLAGFVFDLTAFAAIVLFFA